MALPILDGNQTAATLSTIVTGGAHIPAHTVVSLGSQAIADISSAVTSVGVSGTVTANVDFAAVPNEESPSKAVLIGFDDGGTIIRSGTLDPLPIRGTVTANLANVIQAQLVDDALDLYGSPANPFCVQGNGQNNSLPISGTVTANLNSDYYDPSFNLRGQKAILSVRDVNGDGATNALGVVIVDNGNQAERGVLEVTGVGGSPLPISGTVTVGSCVTHGVTIANSSVTVGLASTTVTVSGLPSGALTTRFGSVTTANTAQITTAVTNTSRKYLLAQNISAGTVTIGIGFSPTTTQGIQLTAGAGLTFDAFCPTGAVYWLGAVTGATWTVLEG